MNASARGFATLLVVMLGCRRSGVVRDVRSPVTDAPSAPLVGDDPSELTYRVAPVDPARSATLRGTVRWRGDRPALDALPVAPSGHPSHCGTTQPWPALELSPEGTVRWSVVSLDGITHGNPPSVEALRVDQRGCRYDPHVAALGVGAELNFTNSDPGLLHNVHAYYGYSGSDNWFNSASPFGVPITRRVSRAGVHRLICDSGHVWMLAYVHAFNHPYFAVTDAAGRWEIRGIPAGTWTLRHWHEGWTRASLEGTGRPRFGPEVVSSRRVTVAPVQTLELLLELASSDAASAPR